MRRRDLEVAPYIGRSGHIGILVGTPTLGPHCFAGAPGWSRPHRQNELPSFPAACRAYYFDPVCLTSFLSVITNALVLCDKACRLHPLLSAAYAS